MAEPSECWVATALQCLPGRETRGGHRQKLYADIHRAILHLAMEQLAGKIRALLKYCKPQQVGPATAGEATKLTKLIWGGQKCLSVHPRWIAEYIGTELGETHDYYTG